MTIEKEFTIIAIHGEGDQDAVNALQAHRNRLDGTVASAPHGGAHGVPEAQPDTPKEPPDVIVIMRDDSHKHRIEWPVSTWEEVEEWKGIAGFDGDKRHWATGAIVKVTIG